MFILLEGIVYQALSEIIFFKKFLLRKRYQNARVYFSSQFLVALPVYGGEKN